MDVFLNLSNHSPTRYCLENRVNLYRFNVELHSTALTAVQGTMSSYIRQRLLLYKVQCRVTFDSAYCCTRYNVELNSTALTVVQGTVSSYIRQRVLLYKVQCRVKFDSAYRCTRYSVELKSTAPTAVQGTVSSSNRHVILCYFMQFYRTFLLYSGWFVLWKVENFREIDLGLTWKS